RGLIRESTGKRKEEVRCKGMPMARYGSAKGLCGAPTLLGVPLDENSSYKLGAAAAPQLIRDALCCESTNMWTELGVDVGAEGAYEDAGDVQWNGDAFSAIEQAVEGLLEKRQRPVCVGGDNSITYTILRAFGHRFKDLTLIHFDAHPDL